MSNEIEIYKNYDRFGTARVMEDVAHERLRQHKKFGKQDWDNGTCESMDDISLQHARDAYAEALAAGGLTWREILNEEVAEAYAERNAKSLRAELVQVAAVVVAWIECLDRHYDWETLDRRKQMALFNVKIARPDGEE